MAWSPTDIIRESSNIGSIMIAQQLGKERLADYLTDFGFGAKTGIGFPGESAGLLRPGVEVVLAPTWDRSRSGRACR